MNLTSLSTDIADISNDLMQLPNVENAGMWMKIITEAYAQVSKAMQANKMQLNVLVVGDLDTEKSAFITTLFGEIVASNSIKQMVQEYQMSDELNIFDFKSNEADIRSFLDDILEKGVDEKGIERQIHFAFVILRNAENDIALWKMLWQYSIPALVVVLRQDENAKQIFDMAVSQLALKSTQIQQVNISNESEVKELVKKAYALLSKDKQNIFAIKQQCDEELRKKALQESAKSIIGAYSNTAMANAQVPFGELPTQCAMIIHINAIYGVDMSKENIIKIMVGFGGVLGAKALITMYSAGMNESNPPTKTILAKTTTIAMGRMYIVFLDNNLDKNIKDLVSNINMDMFKKYFKKEYLLDEIILGGLGSKISLVKAGLSKVKLPFGKSKEQVNDEKIESNIVKGG